MEEVASSLGFTASIFGLVFYLVNMLGQLTVYGVRSLFPKGSVLTEGERNELRDLHTSYNVVQEAQQKMVALLQSMLQDASTQSQYMQAANERNVKSFDQLFKLMRNGYDKDREHDTDVATSMSILLERSSGN